MNSTPGVCTRSVSDRHISSKVLAKSTSCFMILMPSESSVDTARISLISLSSMSQLFMITFTISCFSSGVVIMGSTSEKPTMEFSGVRISWVILAMNTDFMCPDSLARSVSLRSCSCFSISGVTLRISP